MSLRCLPMEPESGPTSHVLVLVSVVPGPVLRHDVEGLRVVLPVRVPVVQVGILFPCRLLTGRRRAPGLYRDDWSPCRKTGGVYSFPRVPGVRRGLLNPCRRRLVRYEVQLSFFTGGVDSTRVHSGRPARDRRLESLPSSSPNSPVSRPDSSPRPWCTRELWTGSSSTGPLFHVPESGHPLRWRAYPVRTGWDRLGTKDRRRR